MGERHNLPMVNILTEDGKINTNGGEFEGLTVQEARLAVIKKMKELGYFVKEVPHLNRIGVSYRSKAIIEPFLSKQWFVKLTAFKDYLKEIVKSGKVKIIPSHWESTYFHWIDNLHDWCISRQLWWGHRIPIWYNRHDKDKIICYDGDDLPEEVRKNPDDWVQDPDVLDTWFSSSLWPSATLGWPEETIEFKRYYPNSTLITGHDILFFWVARMLMMGEAATGTIPFPETFLHGLIYGKSYWKNAPNGGITYITGEERKEYDIGKELPKDVHSKWEKMSKSKGNIIDPLEIINEYGTDACRMALASSATSLPQIDLDRRRFEEFKNFANKIWNGARFVFMNLEGLDAKAFSDGLIESLLTLEDRWILSRLQSVTKEVHQALNAYTFDRATNTAYEFFWNELCAYYLEISKPVLFGKQGSGASRLNKQKLLAILLLQAIRLLHPMCPFITEELFQLLKNHLGGAIPSTNQDPYTQEAIKALQTISCMTAPFPEPEQAFITKGIEEKFELLCSIVYAVRNIRGEMKVPVGIATDVCITGNVQDPDFLLAKEQATLIGSLVKIKDLTFQADAPKSGASTAVVNNLHIFVFLPEELKVQERTRLAKEEEKLTKAIEQLNLKLSNSNFLEKAPQDVVQKLLDSKTQSQKQLEVIQSQLACL
jgi:valyl-tRNA synthetase